MTNQIPQTPVQPARRSLMDRFSIVWIVPIGALLIALGIAWQSYQDRGPLIEIQFQNASGIVAEQTELQYREVQVGVVEEVSFAPDLSSIVAHVRVDKQVAEFVDQDSVFWVVRPEVSTRGVTGLSTVLSGVYIEGSWDDIPGGFERDHVGLEEAPLARPDQPGTRIVLRAVGRGLNAGAPIIYNGVEVGRVGTPHLAADGASVEADAFVFAPHDELLTSQSRFWDLSGISFNLGPTGASIDIGSLSSIINGGVSFETVVSGGSPATNGMSFTVYGKQDEARASLFDGGGGGKVQLAVVFEENVTGLKVGAPVTLRGLQIGEVASLTGRVDEEQYGDDRVRLIVVLSIGLENLSVGEDTEPEEILDFFQEGVAEGWRARLAKASILTGGLRVEFVQLPDAEPAVFQRDADPYPIMPSVTAELPDTAGSAEGLLERVSNLPVEELMRSATTFMENAANLVASPELQAVPAEVSGLITDIRNVVKSPGVQQLPDVVEGVADEITALLEAFRDAGGVTKLVDAVDSAGVAAAEVAKAAQNLPQLVDEITAVATKAAALDLDGLMTEASGLVASARDLIGSDATQALPGELATAIDGVKQAVSEVGTLLTDLNENESATRLLDAIDAAGEAARGVNSAMADVPAVIAEIEAVAAKAAALDLETFVTEATGLAQSANAFISSEATMALPDSLSSALDDMDAVLGEARALMLNVNQSGTVEKLNEVVIAARDAATGISSAIEGVPELIEGIDRVVEKAETIDLNPLVTELTDLVASADALIGTEDAKALPAALNAALGEVSAAVEELRAGGTVENVNAALASAQQAADSVATATSELPDLVRRAELVLQRASAALETVGENGALQREASAAMREVSRAAQSVSSLARMLERKPNALLTGR